MPAARRLLLPVVCLLAPVFVVLLGDRWLHVVACSYPYYGTCNDDEFFIQNDAYCIPLTGIVNLFAHGTECPVSWSILSQPGGWKITDLGNAHAKLEPVSGYGSSGDITVGATSSTSCSDSVMISANSNASCAPCDSCACPTPVNANPKANGITKKSNGKVAAVEKVGAVFQLTLDFPAFDFVASVRNPGKAGDLGIVQILESGSQAALYERCSYGGCDYYPTYELSNGPLNDGRTIGEPCPNADHCPWTSMYYFTPATGKAKQGPVCNPINVPCGTIAVVVTTDQPLVKLGNVDDYPYYMFAERSFTLYAIWDCDTKKIYSQAGLYLCVSATYNLSSCPATPTTSNWTFSQCFRSSPTGADTTTIAATRKFCALACTSDGGPIDCACSSGYGNYDAVYPLTGNACE